MSHEQRLPLPNGLTRLTILPTNDAVRSALAKARHLWALQNANPDLCAAAEQVLAEVLNNVVEHAQAGKPDGIVLLDTVVSGDTVDCMVHDDGAEMPGLQLPAGKPRRIGNDLNSLPEGGFGWFMIHSMSQNLSYDREDGWNHLRFTIADETAA